MPGPFLPTSIANAAKKRLADVGRRIPLPDLPDLDVPNPFAATKDVLGDTFRGVTSAEEWFNKMTPGAGTVFKDWTPGTDIKEGLERVPRGGRALGTAFDVGLAPATVFSAGIGPEAQAGIKALPRAVRYPLNVIAPASRSANPFVRLGAETAIGTAGVTAAQEAAERTDNPFLIGAAGLGAGILASGAVSAAPSIVRGLKKGAGKPPIAQPTLKPIGEVSTAAEPTAAQFANVETWGRSAEPLRTGREALDASWVAPGGRMEIGSGAFYGETGATHESIANELGKDARGLLDYGWVRRAAPGAYEIGPITSSTLDTLDRVIAADAPKLIAAARSSGRAPVVFVDGINGDVPLFADARKSFFGELMQGAKPKAGIAPTVVESSLPDMASDPVRSLIKRVGEAKPLQEQNKELLTQFHGRQAGSFEQALGPGEAGFRGAMSAMQGQAERIGFEPLRPSLGQEGVDALFDSLKEARLQTFDHVSAGAALRDILDGRVPVDSELKKLELAFPGVTDSLRKAKIIAGPGPGAYLSDGMNAVMSLKSGLDISGLRQTATAAYGHPVMFGKAFKRSLQSFASEDSYNQVLEDLNRRWYKDFRDEAGVMLNTSERAITRGEGTIIARTVNRIPGYRASNRAYTSLVNLMRDGVFADMLEGTGVNPKDIPLDELKRMGRLANVSTGRGSLPKFIADSQVANTPVFWAPRLVMSRFEMPFEVLSKSPVVRKEAARQLAAFVGVNGMILGLLKASGAADVEADPRSADFGQVRLGNQRIDPWFGFRPVANLVTRLATGERKSTTTGAVSDVEAKQILSDFLRQKFSPLTQVGVNLYNGENAIGEPYGLKDVPEDAFLSLFLSDLKEAVKTGGVGDIPAALPSVLGFGTNAYEPNLADTADFGKLTGEAQFKAHRAYAWQTMGEQDFFKAEVAGIGTYSDWRKKKVEEVKAQLSGMSPAAATATAEQAVDEHPVSQAYTELRNQLEDQWGLENPEEALKLLDRESKKPEQERTFRPTQKIRAALEEYRSVKQ